jgi:acylpyruvate hydrolase
MRLSTVRLPAGGTAAEGYDGDDLVLLQYDDVGTLLASGKDWLEWAAKADGDRLPLAGASLAPVVPHPNKIVCLGLNARPRVGDAGREPQLSSLPDNKSSLASRASANSAMQSPLTWRRR